MYIMAEPKLQMKLTIHIVRNAGLDSGSSWNRPIKHAVRWVGVKDSLKDVDLRLIV
mgnify:CR=1 FL=1